MVTESRRTPLPPLDPESAALLLAPPRLPAATVATLPLARRAAGATIPVLITAPAGAGRLSLARALHAVARPGPFVVAAGRRPALADLPAGTTLYVDVCELAPAAILALEALLADGTVWVLAAAAPGQALPSPLAARLGAVVVALPPLSERRAELPALAESILATLGARSGGPAPALTPAAGERLAAHAWPGDVAELETVLARAFLLADGAAIDAAHLDFTPATSHAGASASADATAGARTPAHDAELEFLLAELAHELRNPMVTIKTYAQHLPALLEDAELRARFERLTDDAIGRMDGLLENVLAFARLAAPRPEPVDLGPLLERVLAEMEPELARRGVRVRPEAAAVARCAADPDQLAYALRNVLAGVIREVPAGEELVCGATANGVVTLRFAAGGEAADRLRRLAVPGDAADVADPSVLPLVFRLARGVLERNGGGLAVMPEGGGTATLVVRLPAARGEET